VPYPPLFRLKPVHKKRLYKVAARVAKVVFDNNLARVARPEDCEAFIRSHLYAPTYRDLV
jgi:hypothetical protein